ncbi:MAG: hypothetical protein ACI8WT_000222 [Clostridium sp.]|jgi:hypothetical protein|uniref:hypothetical protein n=1 Tax=Clostridium sp. TaxID=1506 RepID=UPI001A3D1133|nr:hypothetical protein [Clostridium sp.]MBK5234872.1 hypothetical protein [Clostridium sp.]
MYDAKKDEIFTVKQLQCNCIGDRSYFYNCRYSNMINIKISDVPVEIITREFK